nr:hypothetical protein [Nonomuraea thailandensis]
MNAGTPLALTTMSPGRMPALAAGLPGSTRVMNSGGRAAGSSRGPYSADTPAMPVPVGSPCDGSVSRFPLRAGSRRWLRSAPRRIRSWV